MNAQLLTSYVHCISYTHNKRTAGYHLLPLTYTPTSSVKKKYRQRMLAVLIISHSTYLTTSYPLLNSSYPYVLLSPPPSLLILCIPCSPLIRVSWYLSKACLSGPCNPLLASSCLLIASSCSRWARWLRSSKSSVICCGSRWRRCCSSGCSPCCWC